MGSTSPGFGKPALEKVQKSLESIAERLKFVERLYTRFLLSPNSVDITLVSKDSILPEWEGITRHTALYFIDQLKTCVLIAEPPKYIAVTDVIASVVSHILESQVPLPIGSLFLCPDYSEAALLDVLKLHFHTRDAEFGGAVDR